MNSIIVGFRLVELTKLLTTIGHLPKRGVDISLKVLIEFNMDNRVQYAKLHVSPET